MKLRWCMKFVRRTIWISLVGVILTSTLSSAEKLTIRLFCWDGYARPYARDFEKLIKQKYNEDIRLEITNLSDPGEFWDKTRSKKADLISPAHNIPHSQRWNFIRGKVILPIELKNIPNYQYLLAHLKKNRFVTQNDLVYGVPYTTGPYGLAYNSAKVTKPESWSVLWQEKSKGRYTISKDYPDCNIYITALVLGAKYDWLYDRDQLIAHIPKKQIQKKLNILAANAASLWKGTANPDEFKNLAYAATWGYAVAQANLKGGKWKMVMPKEGTTMWADYWVITYAVKNDSLKKRICEEWINYCLSPKVQVGVIRNWGVSPVVTNIKDLLTKDEIKTFKVGDNDYWKTLSFWENQNARTINFFKHIWKKAMLLNN